MCLKLPPRDLNFGPYPPHSINTYTFGVTIAPRVCGSLLGVRLTSFKMPRPNLTSYIY